jgi:hypothetical protein
MLGVRHFLSDIGQWLVGLFEKTRPGLVQFLKDHESQAVTVLQGLLKEFEGIPLNQWRDRAFADLSAAVNNASAHPDTWVSVLLDLGYDIVKAQRSSQ